MIECILENIYTRKKRTEQLCKKGKNVLRSDKSRIEYIVYYRLTRLTMDLKIISLFYLK